MLHEQHEAAESSRQPKKLPKMGEVCLTTSCPSTIKNVGKTKLNISDNAYPIR